MSREPLTGSRIRERRGIAGLRQVDLARSVGISASYLNLIEHNRRRIGGKLLLQIAEALEVEPALLSEGAEARVVAALREAAADRADAAAELDRIDEFAGRFPGWARLLAELQGRGVALEQIVETLTDRLAHDPHLAASLHEVLSTVTAIRSTAAILSDTAGLEPEWRDRFQRNIREDSKRLAESVQGLVTYLDNAGDAGSGATSPQEEIERHHAEHGYHVPSLEPGGDGDPAEIASGLGSATARFAMERHLRRYRSDAAAMPLEPALDQVARTGLDPLAFARAFGTDCAAAMRRLAALPQDRMPGPLGAVICDASGTLTFRRPVEGFALPRFGAACPFWPLFQALSRPQVPLSVPVAQAGRDGGRFRAYAVAQPVLAADFNADPLLEATMLLVPEEIAVQTGDHGDGATVRQVGPACRICPQPSCPARREPSILADGF
ncbi:helix-turn-helix domain-containing protein [Aquicoccus sp. SCR17]|nr:helix-turn-helix domain-containing protein [Carideicomes alvinocaridis]